MDLSLSRPWLNHYPQDTDWAAPLPAEPVPTLLDNAAKRFGHRPAIDFLGKRWTWAQVSVAADRLAAGLQAQGVKRGVKVGLFLPNCPYFVISYYAILRAGGTVVNFNPLYALHELRHQVEDSGTSIMITLDLKVLYDKVATFEGTCLETVIVCPFAASLPVIKGALLRIVKRKELAQPKWSAKFLHYSALLHGAEKPSPVTIDPHQDIAVLQYTGGTTGVPKGAMLTHANITANTEQSARWFSNVREGEDRMLGVLPFFHVFAMTVVMNMSVRCGLEIVALPRFDLKDTLRVIAKKRITCLPAVPAIYNAINNAPTRSKFDFSSLRTCISGGAPLPDEVRAAWDAQCHCPVLEGYGLTEASPVVSMNPVPGSDVKPRAGTIGLPMPGTDILILGLDDGQPKGIGERGELCVKGPQVMRGYYNKADETTDVFFGEYLRTGDVAVMDEDGFLTIVDRIKDMIIVNGYKVYPRLVEEVVYLFPGVEECIVAGVKDERKGEVVKAWIKPKAGATVTVEELKVFLKGKLSSMEMPRQFEVREKPLPKTTIGKLSRKDMLREDAEGTK